jgi:hypothetical protein
MQPTKLMKLMQPTKLMKLMKLIKLIYTLNLELWTLNQQLKDLTLGFLLKRQGGALVVSAREMSRKERRIHEKK